MSRIVQTSQDFAGLESHWEALSALGAVKTPFQSFAWIAQWLRHKAPRLEPLILVLHDGRTIAPLGRYSDFGVRVLRLLGAPDSDYPGLVTTSDVQDAWEEVARGLERCRHSFDVVHLHSVLQPELIIPALARHLGTGGQHRSYDVCPWIATDLAWSDLLARQGSGLRGKVKRWSRRVEELGEVSFEQVRPPLSDALLEEIADVERDSWKWEKGNSMFRNDASRGFLEALLRDRRANITIWLLRVDGRLVAHAVVLISQARWYYYLATFRKDVANAGALLLSHIVEAACDGDCEVIDLLRGDQEYKRVWTNLANTVHEIVWPSNIRGRAAALAYAARWRAARSRRLARLRSLILRVGDRR